MKRGIIDDFFDWEKPPDNDSERFIERNPAQDDNALDASLDCAYLPSIQPNLLWIMNTYKDKMNREGAADKLIRKLMTDTDNVFNDIKKHEKVLLVRSLLREIDYKPGIKDAEFLRLFNYCKTPWQGFVEDLAQRANLPVAQVKEESPIHHQSFDHLFTDSRYAEPCYKILMDCEKPLISREFEYIGTLKGAFCVWTGAMEYVGGIIKKSTPEIYAGLLGKKIKNFSIHKTMFEKAQTKAEKKYRGIFERELSKIKRSVDSENRK